MFSVTELIEIANISELRTKAAEIYKKIQDKKRIIVTKNNQPAMIILNFEEYQKLNRLLEEYEDHYFGKIAMERLKDFDKEKAIALEDLQSSTGSE